MKKYIALLIVIVISFTAINVFAVDETSLSNCMDATIGKSFFIDYTCQYDNTSAIEGTVLYNSDILEFVGISTSIEYWRADIGNEGRIVVYNDFTVNAETQKPINKGTVAFSLEFKFKQGVADKYEATIALSEGLDDKNNNLNAQCTATLKWLVGDCNNDGEVNASDRILLSRYLAKWNGYTEPYNADIDKDGAVTQIDRIILSRYLAGWGGTYNTYFK